MADWLNSSWYPVVGYGAMAVLAGIIGRLEFVNSKGNTLPIFWWATALLALAMGVGRAFDAGGWIAELGRRQLRSTGWYEERRGLQIVVVGALAALAVVIFVTGVKFLGRRRAVGHLPVALLMSALVGYSVVRVVSLHQIDSFWQAGDANGATSGTLFELVLLGAAVTVTVGRLRWVLAGDDARASDAPGRG